MIEIQRVLSMTNIKKSAMNHRRRLQLRDTLMNCSEDVIQNDETKLTYAKGVLAGVVGAIMTVSETSFEETVEFTKQLLPEDFDERCIPPWKDWQDAFRGDDTMPTLFRIMRDGVDSNLMIERQKDETKEHLIGRLHNILQTQSRNETELHIHDCAHGIKTAIIEIDINYETYVIKSIHLWELIERN